MGTNDADGDGQSDVILRNSATGTLTAWFVAGRVRTRTAILGVTNLAAQVAGMGRVNVDGREDLILHTPSLGALVTWFLRGVTAPWKAPLQSILPTWSIADFGDFDGDRRVDFAFRQPTHHIAVRLRNGTVPGASIIIGKADPAWAIVPAR